MERVWQWAWDRYGPRYAWASYFLVLVGTAPMWVAVAVAIAAFEESDRYLWSGIVGVIAGAVAALWMILPGSARWRPLVQWAAGERLDRYELLASSYELVRQTVVRAIVAYTVVGGVTCVAVGAICGANASRLIQYGIIGVILLAAIQAIAVHQVPEAVFRPLRMAIAGDTGIGDSLPRSRPSFATWSTVSILAATLTFSLAGAFVAAGIDDVGDEPVIAVAVAVGLTLVFAAPLTVVAISAPSFRPIRDLAEGTQRVAAGDYAKRLPVVQDDDLGALAGSFNRMQEGLAERERLHAAFGSYVDPALAERLLAQGDDLFQGEEVDVTVFFADIRNFTTYAEHATASEAVARLNSLWAIIVPILRDHHGHANKFLGDGVLAVFGVPEALTDHADHAVAAAQEIQQRVRETFGPDLRIGIGINTGNVIAGTIGGGGKLEFTLIGDPVNVAARVEQLTKETGDSILLTQATVDALHTQRQLEERGTHAVRGRDASVNIYAIDTSHRP